MSLSDLNLTEAEWEALRTERAVLARHGHGSSAEVSVAALDKILAHRPKPVLEDGIYRDEAGAPREIVDGKVRGVVMRRAFYDQDHEDTSGWTPLRVLADDEVVVKREDLVALLDAAPFMAVGRRNGKAARVEAFCRLRSALDGAK